MVCRHPPGRAQAGQDAPRVVRAACGLTRRCTRQPPAGFARFRLRVNSNVNPQRTWPDRVQPIPFAPPEKESPPCGGLQSHLLSSSPQTGRRVVVGSALDHRLPDLPDAGCVVRSREIGGTRRTATGARRVMPLPLSLPQLGHYQKNFISSAPAAPSTSDFTP